MLVHGAAHVHEQEHFHAVVALGHELDVQHARIGRSAVDGVVEIEFLGGAFTGEATQAAQRHLDVARAQLLGVVVVLVGALVPHLHRTAVASLVLADADALRVIAVRPKRAGPARADHAVAALVALLLLLEALFQRLHQFVPAHLLDGGLFLGGELQLQRLAQPLQRHVLGEVGQQLHPLEVGGEGAVELVEVRLVLDQGGARQEVELVHARTALIVDNAGLERLQQGEVLLHRHR